MLAESENLLAHLPLRRRRDTPLRIGQLLAIAQLDQGPELVVAEAGSPVGGPRLLDDAVGPLLEEGVVVGRAGEVDALLNVLEVLLQYQDVEQHALAAAAVHGLRRQRVGHEVRIDQPAEPRAHEGDLAVAQETRRRLVVRDQLRVQRQYLRVRLLDLLIMQHVRRRLRRHRHAQRLDDPATDLHVQRQDDGPREFLVSGHDAVERSMNTG